MREHVGCTLAVRIDSGLIRDQANSYRMIRIGVKLAECMLLAHVDPRTHFAVASSDAPLSHQRFVVSGDASQPQLLALVDREVKRPYNGGCNVGAQRHNRSVAVGVHPVSYTHLR